MRDFPVKLRQIRRVRDFRDFYCGLLYPSYHRYHRLSPSVAEIVSGVLTFPSKTEPLRCHSVVLEEVESCSTFRPLSYPLVPGTDRTYPITCFSDIALGIPTGATNITTRSELTGVITARVLRRASFSWF